MADAGSRDGTAEVADIAGCRFMASSEPLGARLKAAAATTRAPWLMFLRAGCVPEAGWESAAERFIETSDRLEQARAAVFRPPGVADLLRPGLAELFALMRVTLGGGAKPEHGLLIARAHYDAPRRPPRRRRRRSRHAAPDRPAAPRHAGDRRAARRAKSPLMPAQAGIQFLTQAFIWLWVPAFAGRAE